VPLGPFNAKNFATTISPWIITAEALEPFKITLPKQEPEPLPYLKDDGNYSYDVDLEVLLHAPSLSSPVEISKSNFKYMYWSANQQLTHHTVTGCNLQVGDLLGSGTISGTEKGTYGSLLEITWSGKEPIKLPNGEERTFLQDGDTLEMRGICKGKGYTIGFGECKGKILPALDEKEFY
jgi:fumarylacetoacetase